MLTRIKIFPVSNYRQDDIYRNKNSGAFLRKIPGHLQTSWNLVRPFSRPEKSWKTSMVMEIHFCVHGKVIEKSWKIIVEKEWSPCEFMCACGFVK